MKKYTTSQKKIDYYQIEQETIRYFVQKIRAQKKLLPDTVHGIKLEDIPLVLMNIRTYKPGKDGTSGADGKPQLQSVDTYIGEDGGDVSVNADRVRLYKKRKRAVDGEFYAEGVLKHPVFVTKIV